MRNNTKNLRVTKKCSYSEQHKVERWLSEPVMILSKFLFWLILFLMIVVEVDGRNSLVETEYFSFPGITEDSMINNINSFSEKKSSARPEFLMTTLNKNDYKCLWINSTLDSDGDGVVAVSYTHLRAHRPY